MSFASRAREEIAQRSLQKDCCVRAAAYGFACFAKYFDKGGLVLQTEQPHTVQLARELFARCGVQGDVLEKQRPSGVLYEFNIREPEQVVRMHELFGTTGSETSLQIDPALIRCQTCVSAYIGAAFFVQWHRHRPAEGVQSGVPDRAHQSGPGFLKPCWLSMNLPRTAPAATA